MARMRQRRQLKKRRLPILIVVILALLITVGVALITNYIQQVNEKKLEVQSEINSEIIEKDIVLEHEQKQNVLFVSSITYPITNIESVDNEITSWIKQTEEAFHEVVDTLDFKKETEQASLEIETEVVKSGENVFQFFLTANESIKENANEDKHSWMINVEEGKSLGFDDLFNKDYLVNNESFTDLLQADTVDKIKNNEAFPFLVDGESIIIEEQSGEGKWMATTIPLIDWYEQVNEQYYAALLSEETQLEVEAIIAEEERIRQEELAQKEKEEQEQAEKEKEKQENPLGDKKYIAVTFDDGPHGTVTNRVLDTLAQYNARATFFMLGDNAAAFPDIAKQVADAGHEIANHSISHPDLATMSAENVREQFVKSKQQILDATGKSTIYFRPPYGSLNDTVLDIARETNQKVMLWSVDTRDWESRNPAAINQVVQQYTRPGSILLMHDIHPTTADALPQMLEYLSNQGYEFVTLSELMPYLEDKGIGPYRGY